MAEEEKNETQEETEAADEAVAEAPAAEEEQAAGSTQQAEPADEAAAEEAAPAEEAEAEDAAPEAADAPAGDEEPEEALSPKQLRKRERSIHSGEAKPERTPEERAAERDALRKANATARTRRRAAERAKRGERGTGTEPAERAPGTKKVQTGTVVSDKADKTITVRVDIVRRHRRYEKIVRQSATVHAHDERNEAAEGDVVRVIESRPLSRTKRWRLVEVVEKAR
jgi:small subunit ribosomal protein S17